MRKLGRAGISLVELLVSLGVLGVILGAVGGVMLNVQRGYVRTSEMARSEDALRVAEATMLLMLRSAGANPFGLTGTSAPRLVPNPLENPDFDNLRTVGDFNPPDGTVGGLLEDMQIWVQSDTLFVRWEDGGDPSPIATPIRSLRFEYFAADGTPLTSAGQAAGATRVRFTITAPEHSRTETLTERQSWVHLRNSS